jgi:alcohol dehydrogenase
MKALVYHNTGQKSWEEKPKPSIQNPTDAIVKILKTAIGINDLFIINSSVHIVSDGRIIGHEGVGIIEDVGNAITNFKINDYVLISSVTSCGKCENCKKQMYSHCDKGGWLLGNVIDGTQAEYVRIPHADNSLYHIPVDADLEAFVMLSNVLPTGFECGVLNGKVKPGDSLAIIGAGPIGMAALLTAQFYAPSQIIMIDYDENRLNEAKHFGANHIVNISHEFAVKSVMDLTDGKGVDTVIEAVGNASTFEVASSIIAVGGHIANIGIHGKGVNLHLEQLSSRNITLTTHLVDTFSIPILIKNIVAGKLDPTKLVSHIFKLNQIMEAYDVFENAMHEKVLKVVLTA